MTDTDRIDFLENFINEHGAIVLHDGKSGVDGHLGIGLRPGLLNRSLREAIDSCAGVKGPCLTSTSPA